MPTLSIIIVSYNVKYFLDQLIQSIQKSKTDFEFEVIIVDNNSPDYSASFIATKYPEITVIANKDNRGYAKANNQGIDISNGEYVLLLNPDTVVQQDTFQKSVDFLKANMDAGSVGVKMIDGAGNFLPESKRGLPTPWVSFCKMLGLHKLFPQSEKFNTYYLGHLNSEEINEVDILTGAYIMIRKEILRKINGLDESYFMYGEDIDLSFKIQKSGYKNYYLPDTQIIHYKGESTDSLSYSRNVNFYSAMLLFADTHLANDWSFIKKWMVKCSVLFAAIIGYIVKRIANWIPFMIEFIVFLFGFIWIKNSWAVIVYNDANYYNDIFNLFNAPLYAFTWLVALIYSGAYDKYPRWRFALFGSMLGLIVVLIIYALLPYELRSSRPIIFISFVWVLLSTIIIRNIWSYLSRGRFLPLWGVENNVLIFGLKEEVKRAHKLFLDLNQQSDRIQHLNVDTSIDWERIESRISQEIADSAIDDLIICCKGFDYNFILGLIGRQSSKVRYRLLPEFSNSIIGSNSSRKRGEIYTLEANYDILHPVQKRLKRLIDILFLILLFPVVIYFLFRGRLTGVDLIKVLVGRLSWVGYDLKDDNIKSLPRLKDAVFAISALYKIPLDKEGLHQINRSYAVNYSVFSDFRVLMSSL